MARLDVRLHLDATVEVEDGDVLDLKERVQAALERVTEPLLDAGAEFAPGNEFYVRPTAEKGEGNG